MKSFLVAVSGICFVLAYIAGFALHMFTCYIAYQSSFLATVLTFSFPVLSELYWFGVIWSANGFLNIYTLACAVAVGLYVVAAVCGSLADTEKAPEGEAEGGG